MHSRSLILGILFLLQTTLGLLGNFCLLLHDVILYFTKCKLRSTDVILMHLTVANSLIIIFKGIPRAMSTFGWKAFLNDAGCKLFLYAHRVGRGMSFGSTCLLSIFQVISISPRDSRWAALKAKAPHYTGFSASLCWVLHLLINTVFPIYVISSWRNKTLTHSKDYGYCSSVHPNGNLHVLYVVLSSFPDALCGALMLWTSFSMVSILYRHKERVQHLHRSSVSFRSSPETRATQTILVLVGVFVFLYSLSTILYASLSLCSHPSWWLLHVEVLTAASYPTLSPFILMRHSSVSKPCFGWIRKTKSRSSGGLEARS